MSNPRWISGCLRYFLLALFAVSAAGQKEDFELRYLVPERLERATTTDDQGLIQWAEFKAEKCASCLGKAKTPCTTCARFDEAAERCVECKRNKDRTATCRPCGGVGEWSDPLDKALCPGCHGAAFLICTVCAGGGRLKVNDAERWSDCPGCRGDGGFACAVCDGKRLVEMASLKPSLRDANAASLAKALEAVDKTLAELSKFEATGKNSRKEQKELQRVIALGQSVLPPLKREGKVVGDYMGKIYGGSQFLAAEEQQANAMNLVKRNSEAYLKHQKRMIELCLKRAEHNEKILAEAKAKRE
jgi:hypothetical protein